MRRDKLFPGRVEYAAAPEPISGICVPAQNTLTVSGDDRARLTLPMSVKCVGSTQMVSHAGRGGEEREGLMVLKRLVRVPLTERGEEAARGSG